MAEKAADASTNIERNNDNIRLALDILNYTVSASKESREWIIVINSEKCIFQVVKKKSNHKL